MEKKQFVIGLDLGGTNSVFGLVDENNEIKATTSVDTQKYEYAWEFVADAVNAINEMSIIAGGIDNVKALGRLRPLVRQDSSLHHLHRLQI